MTASRILVIADSLRAASHTTRQRRAARRADGSQALRDRIAAADGLLAAAWSSPR